MSFDSNVDRVCQAFQDRAYLGYQKYGTTTERKDIAVLDWLQHLQEELMDATIYIERLKQEVALIELHRIDCELFGDKYVHTEPQERELP